MAKYRVISCGSQKKISLRGGLKGHKSLRVLYGSVFQQCVVVSQLVSQLVTRSPIELSGDS